MWGDMGRNRARLAQPLDDVVCTERELHVQIAVEVGVVADDDLGAGGQRLLPGDEPVGDLARLLHQVAARRLVQVLLALAFGLRLGEGEDQRAGRLLGLGAQPLPQAGRRPRASLAPAAGVRVGVRVRIS